MLGERVFAPLIVLENVLLAGLISGERGGLGLATTLRFRIQCAVQTLASASLFMTGVHRRFFGELVGVEGLALDFKTFGQRVSLIGAVARRGVEDAGDIAFECRLFSQRSDASFFDLPSASGFLEFDPFVQGGFVCQLRGGCGLGCDLFVGQLTINGPVGVFPLPSKALEREGMAGCCGVREFGFEFSQTA